jgi:hypothetical protein
MKIAKELFPAALPLLLVNRSEEGIVNTTSGGMPPMQQGGAIGSSSFRLERSEKTKIGL